MPEGSSEDRSAQTRVEPGVVIARLPPIGVLENQCSTMYPSTAALPSCSAAPRAGGAHSSVTCDAVMLVARRKRGGAGGTSRATKDRLCGEKNPVAPRGLLKAETAAASSADLAASAVGVGAGVRL